MTLAERLKRARIVFIDTAPLIYHIERNSRYGSIAGEVFALLDAREFTAITSPITLAECLVVPFRTGNADIARAFERTIISGKGIHFVSVDRRAAVTAADIRARHGFPLTDALQIAVAVTSRCGAFLTNDRVLARDVGIEVILLDDYVTQ